MSNLFPNSRWVFLCPALQGVIMFYLALTAVKRWYRAKWRMYNSLLCSLGRPKSSIWVPFNVLEHAITSLYLLDQEDQLFSCIKSQSYFALPTVEEASIERSSCIWYVKWRQVSIQRTSLNSSSYNLQGLLTSSCYTQMESNIPKFISGFHFLLQ